jgi:ABC-2 type transport system ATP-binding protein
MNSAILKTEQLCVGYPKMDVLTNVNLCLNSGETVGLIGLNGAGKTTLIKTLLELRKAKSGSFAIDIRSDTPAEDPQGDRGYINALAYLPEKFEPPAFLTGYEFIEFSLKVYGRKVKRDVIRLAVHDMAFDMKFLDKRVSSYSKGMRQKIGLLATVLARCSLMILDEPMSGLDPFSRSLVKDLIKAEKEKGASFLISSHVLSDMEEICDKIAIIDGGGVHFFGLATDFVGKSGAENLERAFMSLILNNR